MYKRRGNSPAVTTVIASVHTSVMPIQSRMRRVSDRSPTRLGQRENPDAGIYYDGCYAEDRDNYIDIILVGDEAAARNITFDEIPSLEGGYSAFYNPDGPGPEPFKGVRYTAPGPPDLEPVIIALDDPMRVDRTVP